MEEIARNIVQTLQESGYEALFAGGCVRDQLRGTEPKDYDIATSARPDEILRLFPKGNTVGAHFGVILVQKGGHAFEIATFREDGDYTDGRRPDAVVFSTPKEDALRRDFTINGMFLDPVSGELVDYVDGQKDLEARLIRCIGNPQDRFREDYLRLLRAIRFATNLGFEIEKETYTAIREVAPRVAEISPERVREELDKIWISPNRIRGFDLLVDSGLMEVLLPEILELKGCEQPPPWHPEGDVFVHTRLMLSLLPENASLPLVLSVLFHDIAKPATFSYDPAEDRIRFNGHDKLGAEMARDILKRYRYSNAIIEAVVSRVANHMKFKDVSKMRSSTLKRFMARDGFADELELHRVDCAGSNQNFSNYEYVKEKQKEFAAEPLIPPRFLTGKDLIERGLQPGPRFKEILTEAQDLQLENAFPSRKEALLWLENLLNSENGSR
ncbi:MAG: CCA tRNA nucleotidyltransferase [Verrucomicrobiales bacterium]|nr:CCA tRNA nucleotidyltransferase [Verrucomicrobiales bacterium]